MKLAPFTGPGSTPVRRRFWEQARGLVLSLQKSEGKNVTIDEREGYGSVINVNPQQAGEQKSGACCIDGECSIVTRSECDSSGGDYLGDDTTCDDVDCTQGACCDDNGDCTLTTLEECTGDFQGYGTTCDPNPCPQPPTTGACCVGTNCTIETPEDCASMGGSYRGNGSTCGPPNPCLGCPDVTNVLIHFSGITFNCCFGGIGYKITVGTSANGLFGLTRSGGAWIGIGGSVTWVRYANPDCTGDVVDGGSASDSTIVLQCVGEAPNDGFFLYYSVAFHDVWGGGAVIFSGFTPGFNNGTVVINELICGEANGGQNGTGTISF